jgi:glutathione S-transferase
LPIALRDAQHDLQFRAELEQGGGKVQTPCLRISDAQGQTQWMYESGDIIKYLQQNFS